MNIGLPGDMLFLSRYRVKHQALGGEWTKSKGPVPALRQAEQWLHERHNDILKNFDPTVTKLRKKWKVVVAPGALDGLQQLDEDD